MKTLADEIMDALPGLMAEHPDDGPLLSRIAAEIGADHPSVRRVAGALAGEGRAKLLRQGRGGALHMLPADHPVRTCCICHGRVTSPSKLVRTCSHSCARRMAWRENADMRARHSASVKAARSTPEARQMQSEQGRKRMADPKKRQEMSERSRRSWADPVTRSRRLVSIDQAWQDPSRRKMMSEIRKKHWQDPKFRAKAIAGMRSAKAKIRRRIVEIAAANPHLTHEIIGQMVGRTAETVAVRLREARKRGEIGPRPGDGPRLALKAQSRATA